MHTQKTEQVFCEAAHRRKDHQRPLTQYLLHETPLTQRLMEK